MDSKNSLISIITKQQELYDRRATNPNPVAKPGTSEHERGTALDLAAYRQGKRIDNREIAEAAAAHGLHWKGDADPVHFSLQPDLASRGGEVTGESRRRLAAKIHGGVPVLPAAGTDTSGASGGKSDAERFTLL